MRTKDILGQGEPALSFEVFPPKTEGKYKSVGKAAVENTGLSPASINVTYEVDGRIGRYTVDIASMLSDTYQALAPAHLTCVPSTELQIHQVLEELKGCNLENVLALRGDIPKDGVVETGYCYVSQLIYEIKQTRGPCVDAACYPEEHVESVNKTVDIEYLKEKVEAGYDFVTTQMFFNNSILYSYFYRIREWGITVPVVVGIMPVINIAQIKWICQMSGTYLSAKFKAILDRFGDNPAVAKQTGIAYAAEQIIGLIVNGINGVRAYSMNKPDVTERITDSSSEIL